MSSGGARKPEFFTALNGLRFLAALCVVFYHYARKMAGFADFPLAVRSLLNCGPAAVNFFFILSGFVLANRYMREDSQGPNIRVFYWERFARLYPAYMIGFLLFLPGAIGKYLLHSPAGGHGPATFALSAVLYSLMLQAWTPLAQSWNGPSWTLSVEAFMYLIFPLIVFRLKALNFKKTLLVLLFAWLAPATVAACHALGFISLNTWKIYVTNNPLLWAPLFVMGICAVNLLPTSRRAAPATAIVVPAVALVALVALAMGSASWVEIYVTGGVAPLLLAVVLFCARTSGGITKIIGGTVFNALGRVSYVFYIIQAPMWHLWQHFVSFLAHIKVTERGYPAWQFWSFLPVLLLSSFAVERYVEAPARRWLLRHWKASPGHCVSIESQRARANAAPKLEVPALSRSAG
ncbi:MAG TPA: acyltransferase [Terriglobales bacterium]|jgi:peptidoglycan/LPS O-acetylase OafA/YrhL|nr:acyltransferase [Terriglobales bacterium]